MHRTNIELDEKLVKEGLRLFKKKTRKELVHFALTELIRREKAKKLLNLEGEIRWEGNLKQMRKPRFAAAD
jgi:Arc/MetJ family transcription regulator